MTTSNSRILNEDLRRHDYERYLLTLFAPATRRAPLIAILALNLELSRIPGAVSQPVLGQMRLAWWREAVSNAVTGDHARGNPVLDSLAEFLQSGLFELNAVIALIDAWEQDLIRPLEFTLAEFENDAGAIGVGLTGLRRVSLGLPGDSADRDRRQGIAWGLVKLIRAIPRMASSGQSGLPVEFCLPEHDLITNGKPDPELIDRVRGLAEAASHHVSLGRDDMARRQAFPALGDGIITARFLRRLQATGYNPFDSRLGLPDGMAAWGLGRAWLLRRF